VRLRPSYTSSGYAPTIGAENPTLEGAPLRRAGAMGMPGINPRTKLSTP
jgi:hypothetical protein